MTPMLEAFLPTVGGFAILLFLLALRMPIGLSLIAVAFFGIALETNLRAAMGSVARLPYELATNWSFSAVPMFLLMGFIASESGLTRGLFSATRVLLARLPGNLACASVLASALFAAASGSSVATASAMARIAIPEMLRRGYDQGLASGAVAAAGTLGSLIPPSILMVLYGVYADVSIGALFLAGILPGILSVVIYLGMIIIRCVRNPSLAGEGTDFVEERLPLWMVLRDITPLPLLAAIVMGSISFGFATPTEAGALGALGAILISLLMGTFRLPVFMTALRQTAITFTSIFIIVIGGALLTRFVAVAGLNTALTQLFADSLLGPIGLIILVSVLYIILGMFIDSIGLLLLTAPLILPMANAAGVDLIWFGIILIKLLEIGLITPPVGLNIFVIQSTMKGAIPMPDIFRGVTWFITMDLVTLVILVAFPAITLWLPSLLN
ncbi:MAG: TRAP transporter large permease subunit [Paracoccaceae bacterium]|nr:TRAP transporter large permease subunit [Paracoccaceae bacterium]